ncbi:caspase domain-containing protein [Amorphoplanes digitatis]|nr:caspase family protein [Actinoplanes digitatis]
MLPDVERSRAVLIGASAYKELTDLPAVRQNLSRLRELLTDPSVWGLPEEHCVIVADEDSPLKVLDAVQAAAEAATDTLLVYYAGHGLLDQSMDLLLALPDSDARRMYMSIRYTDIRRELRRAVQCSSKVVILDCCFSGSAMRDGMGRMAEIADQAAVEGSWLVTASAEHAPALSPPGEPYTAFTGELIKLLDRGVKDGPEFLDVDTLYLRIYQELKARDRPEPQQRIGNKGAQIVIARNRWTAQQGEPEASGTSYLPPELLRDIPRSLPSLSVEVDERRIAGRDDDAERVLRAIGQHRSAQEVAATLGWFEHQERRDNLSAVLLGLSYRDVRDSHRVFGVLTQIDAPGAAEALLVGEAGGPPERIAQWITMLLQTAEPEGRIRTLLDAAVVSAAQLPDRLIDIISSLLVRKLTEAMEYLLDRYGRTMDGPGAAVVADALRETGRDEAAYRLYPLSIDTLADRAPVHIAALVGGLRAHGMSFAAGRLAIEAAARQPTADDRADLIMSMTGAGDLDDLVDGIVGVFAEELGDDELGTLADILRQRGGNAVGLYIAKAAHRPIEVTIQYVNELVETGRPVDAFAILEQAGADRDADELDQLTRGIIDTPGHRRSRRVFAAVAAKSSPGLCDLYEILHRADDGRAGLLREALLSRPTAEVLRVVVALTRTKRPELGTDLLVEAVRRQPALLPDGLELWGDEETIDPLILATAGAPSLGSAVPRLVRKRLQLHHGAVGFDDSLTRHPPAAIFTVITAYCTVEGNRYRMSTVTWLVRRVADDVAFLLHVLAWGARSRQSAEAMADAGAATLELMIEMAVRGGPRYAIALFDALLRRNLGTIMKRFVVSLRRYHTAGVDIFILASALHRTRASTLSIELLRGRAQLPFKATVDPFATAVSEILYRTKSPFARVIRYPAEPDLIAVLRHQGLVEDDDHCLLILQYQFLLRLRRIVFTGTYARHWSGTMLMYSELVQADRVVSHGTELWLSLGGTHFAGRWTMGSNAECNELAALLRSVRERLVSVKSRYQELAIDAPAIARPAARPSIERAGQDGGPPPA